MTSLTRLAAAAIAGTCMVPAPATASPGQDVRSAFERFVAAQNAHDLASVGQLLADASEFVWVTRGNMVRGRAAALDRFRDLYRGTWHLTVTSPAETFVIDRKTVQLIAPVTFDIGPPGAPATQTRFQLAQLWRRSGSEWRIVSILPIPVPPN